MVKSISHLFFHVARKEPGRSAYKEKGGDARIWTYSEMADAIRETALGLSTLGVRNGDRVALLADNSVQWILCDLAVLSLGAADVPRGTDTSPGEVDYLIRHSGARHVIVQNRKTLEEFAPVLSDIADLQCIILQEGSFKEGDPRTVLSLAEVRERGRKLIGEGAKLDTHLNKVGGNDTATIVYTSGTTGKPKGVVLSHDNILHNIRTIPAMIDFGADDVFLSILPAWHMFERLIEYVAISKGCLTIYTSRKNFKLDLTREHPTVLAAVPRVYEVLYEEARKKLRNIPNPKRTLVDFLMRCSELYRSGCLADPSLGKPAHPLFRTLRPLHLLGERMVYRRFRDALGGRLRTLVTGGGSLPIHVDRFFDVVGLPLLNGYGLTETSPLVSVRRPKHPTLGTVGPPVPATVVEIRDPEGHPVPKGDIGVIHVKGPQVMSGYYRDREETAKVLGDDGFFSTGDLGVEARTGDLEITGRAKDTIVLSGGENVEPEPIENALRLSPIIEQVIVVGQDRKQLGALIVLNLEEVEIRLPVAVGADSPSDTTEETRTLVREEMNRLLHRHEGFKPFEQIRRFAIIDDPFTMESGELTETLKPKRHVISERHQPTIENMFKV